MSYYEVLLFLHITTAVIWLGSGFFVQMLIVRAQKTGDQLLLKQFSGHTAWMAQRIFIPASLAVLVFGILLTIEGPWTFGQLWIVLGLDRLRALVPHRDPLHGAGGEAHPRRDRGARPGVAAGRGSTSRGSTSSRGWSS